jgi:hypothetical protein
LTEKKLSKAEYDRQYHKQRIENANDVGELPAIVDPALRERTLASLETFLVEFFPEIFPDPFGPVQKSSIAHEQKVYETGAGRLNKLEPRGYGKSTRSCLGALWAILKGVQSFVVVCCDSTEKSDDLLKLILAAVSENEKLLGCFPELFCFHKLQGNPHRGQYQTFKGKKTNVSIRGDTIMFPELPGFKSSGAIIVARPFRKTRGKNIKGKRPTVVILDDVQSSDDAISETAIQKNLKTLYSDIAFLGSRKRQIAIINNATIIAPDDYAHRLSKNRAFVTVRYRMVEAPPTNLELWEQYRAIRSTYNETIPGDDVRAKQAALEFYLANRPAMDEGSRVTWDYAFSPSAFQASTIQAAMDFIADYGQEAFDSECQNDPQEIRLGDLQPLKANEVERQVNKLGRLVVPDDADYVTGFIDISEKVLWWAMVAWRKSDFTGSVIGYGVYPEQGINYVTLGTVRRTIRQRWKGDYPTALANSLEELVESMAGELQTETGDVVTASAIAIDSGWGEFAPDVYRFCRQSKFRAILRPSKGMGIGAKRNPLVDPQIRPKGKESIEGQWKFAKTKAKVFLLAYDTNFWKSKISNALRIPAGSAGGLSLYKVGASQSHRMIAEQLTAERPDRVEANGRVVDEWSTLPGRDNHFFDCVCGAGVLAHTLGCRFVSARSQPPRNRKGENANPEPSKAAAVKVPKPVGKPRRRAEVNF